MAPAASIERVSAPRLSIARRPPIELPLPIAAAGIVNRAADAGDLGDSLPDLELNSTFDVPAFLRRQEG